MRAMVFDGESPVLREAEMQDPAPRDGELLINVHACGVCRTDLHVIDGDLKHPKKPLIPGHEIVGTVAALGSGVTGFAMGDRIGVPWLGYTCGHCRFCTHGHENLCDAPRFTGYTIDGGYSTRTIADARYCFHLPEQYCDIEAAPLLCAGLIGYRSLVKAGDSARIGIFGFGAAAHIVAQVAKHQGRTVYAFTRPGDVAAQEFARRLGASWAGGSDECAPEELDAALLFAPVGELVPVALRGLAKGGTVVCGGIHMSDIPSFPYALLWEERRIVSVANLTREDGESFMKIASEHKLAIETTAYPLACANEALADLRNGTLTGAAVLTMI
ncbi:zinc-dependent alcohol dehydrogenase family protein [Paraburkholderia sp. J8-2]|uniref:zinc-dependent alcohol dehydrogenase family protein n=1 Tax=Paraburkholderia sp. J8-2 TaxID=2805440 RepID=UPI002AB5F41D|nr:zinc-dependent alcohol dehydrogenase family protein [Paraburkholderia sp. J8-2]